MRSAIISVTKNGTAISEKIAFSLKNDHECIQYAFGKYANENTVSFAKLGSLVSDIFSKYDALVFICACGIAVRTIAPFVCSKLTDPAVIVIDEQGKFAVSLLSGHIGKANALTQKIADISGAIPVITTATDIGKKFSPDSFALANDLHICETDMAKEIAAAVLNNEKIGIYSDYPIENLPECFSENSEIGISISENFSNSPFKKTLHLVPKNIVMGIGCKRNTDADKLEDFILKNLEKYNIPIWRVRSINTIDLKKYEAAICEFAEKYDIPLKTFSADELTAVDGDFSSSEFVLKTAGTDNVCERSACADSGILFAPKYAENGMTFALSELSVQIDFENLST
ncbi:MAG: cobalt-precorrin 5A hydrolase [Clostridium sp.]|nr:cobalt-precorrin 5A hydrolase [Clostridium sp.]MCM1547000.1 cobalt-precorrin 5A hydrolase [Ruminococcus sp.]